MSAYPSSPPVTISSEGNSFSILFTGTLLILYRSAARSGLRLDMSTYSEPIVFAPSWKLGDDLSPPETYAVAEEDLETGLKVRNAKAAFDASHEEPNGLQRKKFRYFRKRDSALGKRNEEVPGYNIITPVKGQQAVARLNAGTYHETLYKAADKSGLFALGGQQGVSISFLRSDDGF